MAYETSGRASGLFRTIGLMALGLVGLCILVVRQPLRVLGLKSFVASAFREGNQIWLSDPEHRGRIQYAVVSTTAGLEREEEVRSLVAELVEDRDWVSLSELLEDWDTARAATGEEWRLIHIARDTVLSALAGEGRNVLQQICTPQADPRIPSDALTEMTTLFRANPDAYPLAALIADARVAQAWDLRGGGYADAVPQRAWDWIEMHIEDAHEMLEQAGVETRNSPLLLNARLSLLPFYEEAEREILKWYEAAVKSDPGDSAPHNTIGNFLLPRWFGDYDLIETTARQATVWSGDAMGTGAYAILYNAALEQESAPLFFLDRDLYQQSIEDLVRYRGANPRHIPFLSNFLNALGQAGYPGKMSSEDKAHWDQQTNTLRVLGLKIVENHLSAIHPDSWPGGEDAALDMISLSMGQELEDGATLVMGANGIKAVFPEPDPSEPA